MSTNPSDYYFLEKEYCEKGSWPYGEPISWNNWENI